MSESWLKSGNGVNQMRKFLKKRSKKVWKRSKTDTKRSKIDMKRLETFENIQIFEPPLRKWSTESGV